MVFNPSIRPLRYSLRMCRRDSRKKHGATNLDVEEFASVWDALSDSQEDAVNLRLRSALMQQIAAIIEKSGWTQSEAAERCNVTHPTPHQRPAPGPHLPLLARRPRKHRPRTS